MTYRSTYDAALDLEKNGHLIRIQSEVDPNLEMAAIHRRVFDAGGPALLFENVKGTQFACVSNLFGTIDRARFLFRHTLKNVKSLIEARAQPASILKHPMQLLQLPFTALHSLPKKVLFRPAVLANTTTIDKLPQIQSWPLDGGAFITLPQVYTESVNRPSVFTSNLGMYRVQLSGNDYRKNEQIGLHYQIHRGIGVHHQEAKQKGLPLKVSIFVGGPPAHSVAAVMPLPEGLPEVAFGGALAGRRFRHTLWQSYRIAADADFCIVGTIDETGLLAEGPFGDHLGYYSLKHDFPALQVESVFHRKNAIWPFTVVSRPPAEDTIFGALIHELTEPMVPVSIPGLLAMHAVDAAGVHPLLLALGSERYTPFDVSPKPREILTIANSVLGFGQASLAKYLFITAGDAPKPSQAEDFFDYCLSRINFENDFHFQANTTIDTLDYSGTDLNQGSKLIVACYGPQRRVLATSLSKAIAESRLNMQWSYIRPGVLAVSNGPSTRGRHDNDDRTTVELIHQLEEFQKSQPTAFDGIAMIVLCDDVSFTARSFSNFVWITFTRSNPAQDVYGIGAFTKARHWGCKGPFIIDARLKKHMAPPLEEDPKVIQNINRLFQKGAPLEAWGS